MKKKEAKEEVEEINERLIREAFKLMQRGDGASSSRQG